MATLNGTYSEHLDMLNNWATLDISQSKISFSFYVPGPDRRYNGKIYNLSIDDVQKLISSIEIGWKRYKELSNFDLPGGVFEGVGYHVYVYTGDYRKGVSIFDSRYLFLDKEDDIYQLILQLEDGISRAKMLKETLFGQ